MTGDESHGDGEDKAFKYTVGHVFDLDDVLEAGEEGGEGDGDAGIGHADKSAAQPADEDGENDQHGQADRDGNHTRQHQVMDRVDVHGAQGVNLLIDAHGADLGGHGRADAAGDEDGHHDRGQLLADGVADHAADGAGNTALDQQWAGLQGNDRADETREDADHEEAGVADFEELV